MSRAVKDIQVIGVREIGRSPYISKAKMMKIFEMSLSTATRRIADLDRYVQSGRYGPYTILDGAGVTRVNVLALVDYLKYKKQLDAGRRVPPFDINKVAKEAVINWDELDP